MSAPSPHTTCYRQEKRSAEMRRHEWPESAFCSAVLTSNCPHHVVMETGSEKRTFTDRYTLTVQHKDIHTPAYTYLTCNTTAS